MKNVIFDLGGVVFARDKNKCTPEFREFWSFLRQPFLPDFWVEYDRGTVTQDEVIGILSERTGRDLDYCREMMRTAIDLQEERRPTVSLIHDLKAAGYKLYVLSNMSHEFIEFLRGLPVYGQFDGEVVSCEELVVKPEREIYELLLSRYGLEASESIFIDDRSDNGEAAAALGITPFLFDAHDPDTSCAELRRILL